jgi:hypothetical protein
MLRNFKDLCKSLYAFDYEILQRHVRQMTLKEI